MRTLLAWFNARRRLVLLALVGLVAVVYVSAGRTPKADEWLQVPDLGLLFALILGVLGLMGLVVLTLVRPNAQSRRTSELSTIRALLVLAVLVGAAAIWFGPSEVVEEAPIAQEEETAVSTGGALDGSTSVDLPAASGTDIAVLGIMLVIIAAVIVRRLQSSSPTELGDDSGIELKERLAPAVEVAHRQLGEDTDPRSAVLKAYSSLESALVDLGLARYPAETPSEHMARVLGDIPELAAPAAQLGALYEIARFSQDLITEEHRQDATRALDRARTLLAAPELSRS